MGQVHLGNIYLSLLQKGCIHLCLYFRQMDDVIISFFCPFIHISLQMLDIETNTQSLSLSGYGSAGKTHSSGGDNCFPMFVQMQNSVSDEGQKT